MSQRPDLTFTTCPSCSKQQLGAHFCAHCGEKRLDPDSRSIKHIISDYIENLTSLDGKIWRTIGLLFLRPGQLDFNYHSGKRIGYIKPIALFLIINVLFVIFSPMSDYYINLYDQLTLQPYSPWINDHFQWFLAESAMEPKAYQALYDQTVTLLSRSTIIIQAMVFFVFATLINYRKGYFSGDHMVFSLNLHSWYMAWVLVLMAVVKAMVWALALLGLELNFGLVFYKLLPVGLAVYCVLAVKTLYQLPWWQAVIKAVLLMLAFKACHVIYRLIQFYLTQMLL